MTTLVFDIETDDLLPSLSKLWLIVIGDPATGEVVAYSDHDPDLQPISQAVERLNGATRLVGHNILNFDIPALAQLKISVDWRKGIDTMILSRLKEPSRDGGHSLGKWGEVLGFPKGDFSDFTSYSKTMLEYALQDVRLNIRVWEELKYLLEFCPKAVEVEHVFGWCMSHQMRTGFCFDRQGAEILKAEFIQEKLDIERKLQEIFPPIVEERYSEKTGKRLKDKVTVFNPGSRKQIADRLIAKYGWKPRSFTNSGQPQVDEAILKTLKYPEAQAMVEYLTITKKLSQVESWLTMERDGRIYGYINTIGANTHRCTHKDPNVAQADKDKRMRSLFKASDGMVLVGCDAEGLELRMLGHYLARWDGGAFSKAVVEGRKEDGTDAHSINQKAVGLHLRDSAKTFIYALIYGAGDAKLGRIIIEDAQKAGKPKPPGSPTQIGKEARARIEKNIVGLGKLVKAVKKKFKTTGSKNEPPFVIGLDGRKVYLRSEHSALNTLLQSAGALVMKWAMLCWWERQGAAAHGDTVFLCANVHDEQQFEALPDFAERVGQAFADAITEAGVRLGVRCPLSGSYDIGPTWAETH